ncbi:MAG: methyltransferase domain-containing protein [Myxococcota bacterium]
MTPKASHGLPFADGRFAGVGMSLFLSYMDEPEDVLFEAWRVLRPGGRLVVSSLVPDYDMSKLYVAIVERFESLPESELPPGVGREVLLSSARRFVDHAAELFRLAEEGHFRLYDTQSLLALVRCRGFVDASAELVFGDPPQAVIVTCTKP